MRLKQYALICSADVCIDLPFATYVLIILFLVRRHSLFGQTGNHDSFLAGEIIMTVLDKNLLCMHRSVC